ncbi:MAG TPA: hypothetical protein VLW25_13855 [Bryobacteraceae bacterium]|nr:hypothetical protein [Bryobacteraceae bacterium]
MSKSGQPRALGFFLLLFFLLLFAITLALRLCHSHILWADEDYHLAAAIQTLHSKLLYRDLWYDKPPLAAWVYAALGAFPGWPLRLFDAFYILAVCVAIYRFARDVWSEREGFVAAGLAGFFLSFDHASAVIPVAPDLFLMLPHIAAVHCAWRKKALQAGLWSGVAFLFHTKGVFVLAMCALLAWRNFAPLAAGFLIPNAAALAVLGWGGALNQYARQVWQWGLAYARTSPLENPAWNAVRRTLDWFGFHAVLVIGAISLWWKERPRGQWWIAAWCVLSLAGVALGAQFAPRYFLQLLPPLVLVASRGLVLFLEGRNRLAWAAVAIAALVPAARFGPRYALLARDLMAGRAPAWSDVVLDQDSQAAAARINERKNAGDTLFVWGYRPGVFVYTRLATASMFWDSQPLTGVPADRHLFDSRPILPELAARNRALLVASHPTFIVDGLSALNPQLSIGKYPELRSWLRDYSLVARTDLSAVYRLNQTIQARAQPARRADNGRRR